ncbi:ABC transporter substrate-binding protein [Aminobacter sp. AP02]|uniref:ABC transporter substrate-binding protein n=1 Tax=Aminobacter sp. AP02 TaxID=2135737 RepID=UPI000D6B2EEE|nr:ABC transporter substrate-binding protein [Aminobacter sp. AP02]PWK76684.1 ABC-type nitrate/sulfonate/bicarbonate transport system substrate-binding protein [Aminobacter sp. AP02]
MNLRSKLLAVAGAIGISATSVLALGTGSQPALASAKEPLTFINLPQAAWTVVGQRKGIIQEEFAKIGITDIKLINPGTAELSGAEAALLDRGGLAIAQRMMYPATVHKANGIDAVIVWQSSPSDKFRTPLLAKASSDINSPVDLKDKKFGGSRVGCGWTSPTEILNEAGVPLDTRIRKGSVRQETITNSAATSAALLSGAIDATATHIALPASAALWLSGEVKVVGRSPDNGVYVNSAGRVSYFAMRPFVEAYPEAIQAFLIAHERTKAWIQEHVDESAEIIGEELRIPVNIAKFQITDPSSFEFMQGEASADNAKKAIRDFQKYYIAAGDEILQERFLTDETIEQFVDARFFKGGAYSVYN